MFAPRYFAVRYYAVRYWPPAGDGGPPVGDEFPGQWIQRYRRRKRRGR